MADFLHELGLGFLKEDLDTISGFLGHVLETGKVIPNYYGLPYINQHFGSSQIICRTARDAETGGLQFSAFDCHADSPASCVWKLRVENKLSNPDDEDPTRVKLLTKTMSGQGLLAIDVVNGDILPSFKKDEVIELQMVAFAEEAEFYADEDAYTDTVEPGPNGKKTMIGENTIFPIGLFSDDEDVKDVVQIHGTITGMYIGKSKFGEEEMESNLRFFVDTDIGEIVVILPFDDPEKVRDNPNMREGKVINCFARLSGDAAIYDYEDGLVKDAENNLKLVAYTLEEGDPERLRPVMADHFVYHSETSKKNIEDIDELIAFFQHVRKDGDPAHAEYATIIGHKESETPEYPAGTRCLALRYDNRGDGYSNVVFVDTDDEGKICRILLSRDSNYRFQVEDPFPEEENDLAKAIENTTYQFSIVGRSHLHGLIDKDTDEAAMEQYIADHREELEADLADLFDREISEEVFSEAFLRGVRKSRIRDYKEEDILALGKQFHKDATLFKSEEKQKEIFRDALILVSAVGRLYIGRADRKKDSDDASGDSDTDTGETVSMSEDKESSDKKREFTILQALKKGYETGDFEDVAEYLTDDSIFKSQWVIEQLTGKDAIMEYLRGKGKTLVKQNALAFGDFIVCPDGPVLRLTQNDEDKVNQPTGVLVRLDAEGMVDLIGLFDIQAFLDSLEEEE